MLIISEGNRVVHTVDSEGTTNKDKLNILEGFIRARTQFDDIVNTLDIIDKDKVTEDDLYSIIFLMNLRGLDVNFLDGNYDSYDILLVKGRRLNREVVLYSSNEVDDSELSLIKTKLLGINPRMFNEDLFNYRLESTIDFYLDRVEMLGVAPLLTTPEVTSYLDLNNVQVLYYVKE